LYISSVGSLRLGIPSATQSQESLLASKAHVMFINLQHQTDRCKCMSSQLEQAPYPVTRMNAATPDTMRDTCPFLKPALPKLEKQEVDEHEDGEKGREHWDEPESWKIKDSWPANPVQSSLFCSNYMAWTHFLENTKAEYALIMEDDIVLNLEKGFWEHVENLLKNDHSCGESWDYLTVDGRNRGIHKYSGMKWNYTADIQCGQKQDISFGHIMNVWCTHFQIIRRSAVQKLKDHAEEHGSFILDHWDRYPKESIKMHAWSPNICSQTSVKKGSTVAKFEECKAFKSSMNSKKSFFRDLDGVSSQCPTKA